MTVVVQLLGGLGNQFFQYALGRTLALKHSMAVKFDTQSLEKDRLRTYSLGHYSIDASVLTGAERLRLGIGQNPGVRIWQLINRMCGSQPITLVRERQFEFDPSILESPVPCYLEGYWQSPRYFASIEPTIREEFTLREPPAGDNLVTAEKIHSSIAVSVHIRRGDYISSPTTNQYHGTCSPEYYRAAEAHLRRKLGKPTLFLFSDDPDWASKQLYFESKTIVVHHNGPERDYEDLRLMTLCQHHIIANSTFSWWGAWLCANPRKIVIAPRTWFRGVTHSTADLIPEQWIRL